MRETHYCARTACFGLTRHTYCRRCRATQRGIVLMTLAVILGVVSALGLVGCAAGYSIKPVSLSPSSVSFAYTYSVEQEYAAVVVRAEQTCQGYGKHARPSGQPVHTSADRAVATFDCVP